MAMVSDNSTQYLFPGDAFPVMPSFVALENEGGMKRGLGDDVRSAAGSQKRDTPPGYMNMNDIHARAVRCCALKTLFCDGFDDPTFTKSALVNDADDDGSSAKISDHDIIDQLFLRGYYPDGLSLATALDENRGSRPGGRGVFHDSLSHLLCSYLVPLALDQEFAPERPTMRQFEAAMDSLKQLFQLPVVIFGPHSKRSLAMERSEIQTEAMSLLRELTTKYTNAEQPIAAEVAACILNKNRAARPLSPWLEDLMLWGTDKSPDLPGLFARRRKPGTATASFLGDNLLC